MREGRKESKGGRTYGQPVARSSSTLRSTPQPPTHPPKMDSRPSCVPRAPAPAQSDPESVTFEDTMKIIESDFEYLPARLMIGDVNNDPGVNEGSCKILRCVAAGWLATLLLS